MLWLSNVAFENIFYKNVELIQCFIWSSSCQNFLESYGKYLGKIPAEAQYICANTQTLATPEAWVSFTFQHCDECSMPNQKALMRLLWYIYIKHAFVKCYVICLQTVSFSFHSSMFNDDISLRSDSLLKDLMIRVGDVAAHSLCGGSGRSIGLSDNRERV